MMKKIIKLFIIIFTLTILSGCSKGPKNIKYQDVFTRPEEIYYVYFYQDQCGACESLKPVISEYSKNSKNEIKLYQIDLKTFIKNEPGDAWETDLIGVNSLSNLHIGATPTLVLIKDKEITHVFVGMNEITTVLKND